MLTVRFDRWPGKGFVIHAKSREKHVGAAPSGPPTVAASHRTTRRYAAVVSAENDEHESSDARSARRGGVPPARYAPRGREHAEARARGARRNHPDPGSGREFGAPGGDVQDARAVRRGGGEDRHHARRRRRFPPLASAGTRASKIPARASRRRAHPCLYRSPKPETSHSAARKPKTEASRKHPKGREADARGRGARRGIRRAERRVMFHVIRGDRLCLAAPRCGTARARPAPRAAPQPDGFDSAVPVPVAGRTDGFNTSVRGRPKRRPFFSRDEKTRLARRRLTR